MTPTQIINQLIWQIDNSPGIEKHGCIIDEIYVPFWMLIRQKLRMDLMCTFGYHNYQTSMPRASFFKKLRFLINAFLNRPKVHVCDFLFISPSIGNIERGGTVENMYHDLYAQMLVEKGYKSLILEQPNNILKLFKKRSLNLFIYTLGWLHIKRRFKGFLFRRKEVNYPQTREFIFSLQEILNKVDKYDLLLKNIELYLLNYLNIAKYHIRMWEEVCNLTRPKVVVLQDVCCGGFGLASLVFKKNKVLVAEDQHGYIDFEDIQYNYGTEIAESEKFGFFPDYILLYGKRWAENININTNKIIIGNAYNSLAKKKYVDCIPRYDILVIPDSEYPEITIDQVKPLLSLNYKILFRPHPTELPFLAKRYADLLQYKNFIVDSDRDVYKSITNAKIIICIIGNYLSTVICESISFGKQIICLGNSLTFKKAKSLFYDNVRYCEINTVLIEEINKILTNNKSCAVDIDYFYSTDWYGNLENWVKNLSISQ